MSGQDQDVEALADKQVGMSGNYKQVSEIQNVWKFLIRDDIERKFSFSFGHYPNHLTPPSWPRFGQLGCLFWTSKRLERLAKRECLNAGGGREIYKQPKQLKVRRNRLLLLTKYALLEKGPKNSGMARPSPLPSNKGNAKKKTKTFSRCPP